MPHVPTLKKCMGWNKEYIMRLFVDLERNF